MAEPRRRVIFPRSLSTGNLRARIAPARGRSKDSFLDRPIPEGSVVPAARPLKSCLSACHLSSFTEGEPNKPKKQVSFHSIEFREHPRELGDNPSVSIGPALSLGWYSEEHGSSCSLSVDEYETARPPRRSRESLCVPLKVRQKMLKEEAGVSLREIMKAQREGNKIKHERRVTNANIDLDSAHFALEKCVRKVKRCLTGSSKKEEQELLERHMKVQELQRQQLEQQQREEQQAREEALVTSKEESQTSCENKTQLNEECSSAQEYSTHSPVDDASSTVKSLSPVASGPINVSPFLLEDEGSEGALEF